MELIFTFNLDCYLILLLQEDIVQGIVTERGIRRGHSKWCHSRSHSAGGIK